MDANDHYTRQDLENAVFRLDTARKLLRALKVYKDDRLQNEKMIKAQEQRIVELELLVKRIEGLLK